MEEKDLLKRELIRLRGDLKQTVEQLHSANTEKGKYELLYQKSGAEREKARTEATSLRAALEGAGTEKHAMGSRHHALEAALEVKEEELRRLRGALEEESLLIRTRIRTRIRSIYGSAFDPLLPYQESAELLREREKLKRMSAEKSKYESLYGEAYEP